MGNGDASVSKSQETKKRDERRRTPEGPLTIPPTARAAIERRRRVELGRGKPGPDGSLEDKPHNSDHIKKQLYAMLTALGKSINVVEDERAKIREYYGNLDYDEQEQMIKEIYDTFSDDYDEHMEATGHYQAIERLIMAEVSIHHFKFPILDISSGTGVPLCKLLEELNRRHMLEGKPIEYIPSHDRSSSRIVPIYINDLSNNMTDKAQQRLLELQSELKTQPLAQLLANPPLFGSDGNLHFKVLNHSFRSLHESRLKEKIGTVLVSQTFHIISPQDKEQLASTIDWALAPGGRVVILEEFAWRARTHPSHQSLPVLKLIESIATPLPRKADIISKFKDSEGRPYDMVSRATERIDTLYRDHEMTITILQKPPARGSVDDQRQINFDL